MSKKILGIDVGNESVKLVLINGKRVEKVAVEAIPQNLVQNDRVVSVESMGEFINDMMHRNGIRCRNAAYVLPNENIFSRTITVPVMTVDQLKINLPYEFSDFITDELRKYVYDYAMLSDPSDGESDSMELMAVAAPLDLIEEVRTITKKAGLKLAKAAPTVCSYISLIRASGNSDREYCVIDLGYRSIRMHLYNSDRYIITRTLDIGLSGLDDIVAEFSNVDAHLAHFYIEKNYDDCQNHENCIRAYENITTELMRALNFFRFSNPDSELNDIWLCGGGASIDPLQEMIKSSLDLEVHNADELLPKGAGIKDSFRFLQAIGAAYD